MAKREYIQANKDWLEEKAKEEGVKALPKGIYYKVLSEGRSSSARLLPEGRKNQDSAKPTVRSIITAHYTGRTIDGKQFDSSRGGVPLACRLCDLIEGWIIAIQQMHIGDKWALDLGRLLPTGRKNFTSQQRWATASSLSQASPVARLLFLKLNS